MSLSKRFQAIRQCSLDICAPLEIEDYVVQPRSEVSPPKWHLGHTTWFFEAMILEAFDSSYTVFDTSFAALFNSYYKAVGEHWLQSERGNLSRPTVSYIKGYRDYVDAALLRFLNSEDLPQEALFLIETGLQHEQQHQELLLMDIQTIFAANPVSPVYTKTAIHRSVGKEPGWWPLSEGVQSIGFEGGGFAYDNEQPRHKVYLSSCSLSKQLVKNSEYAEFISDGGYTNPLLWLSQGWDWVNRYSIQAPLYWSKDRGSWREFSLNGLQNLDPEGPVMHISYFEASAFAKWSGARLPTEQESELYLVDQCPDDNSAWWWTQSAYAPYPGFETFKGTLGEYNGKFMCNQFVLKGGCFATPKGHLRPSYRNFYLPEQRWMFSGIRLAKDSV